jgi:PDZ domain
MIGFLVIELRIARPVQIATSYFDKRRCDGTILLLMLFPTSKYSGLVLLVAIVAPAAEPQQAPLPRVIPIAELVQLLGSDDFQVREAASKRLSAMTLDPPPVLLAAMKSDNPEVRDRAAKAAQAMRWNMAATKLPRGERFAEQGRVDMFVAATAEWDFKADDSRLWEPAVNLGRQLIERADMKGDRKPLDCPSSTKDFTSYAKRFGLSFTRMDAPYLRPNPDKATPPVIFYKEAIQAPGVVDPAGIVDCLIVSRGSVLTERGILASVVFANGNVTAQTIMQSAVIVCDGDVTITDRHISTSLIVARGNISSKEGANTSVLMAGGKVTLQNQDRGLTKGKHYNVIKENEPNTLGILFFELQAVGVEVNVAEGAVKVAAIADGKAFAKADIRKDDIVTAVNGKKPDSAESLRRLLRDALALGDATVTLRRGDKIETVRVSLPE